MGKKETRANAEIVKGPFAFLGAVLFLAVATFLVGWALHSLTLGLGLVAWSLVIGPVVLPFIFVLRFFLFGPARLYRLQMSRELPLSDEYFRLLLAKPGPRLRIWVRPSDEIFFYWFENIFSFRGRQELVVSSAWLQEIGETKRRDFRCLWERISRIPPARRRLRTLQMMFWMASIWPVDLMASLFQILLRALGFRGVPRFQFFLLRLASSFKAIFFSVEHENIHVRHLEKSEKIEVPKPLESLIFCPWTLVPRRFFHPFWGLVTHSDNVLEAFAGN